MRSAGFLITAALVLAAVVSFTACQQTPTGPPTVNKPLAPPPTGEVKYAGLLPAHPFSKQAGNYFTRTVFETDGPSNSHIEVRDILIPPNSKSSVEALQGTAVVDPSGAEKLTLSTGDKREALAASAFRSVQAGQALEFENADSRPATIRLYVIRAR